MGIIRKDRRESQEEGVQPPNVWIEDPDGTGQLILVKASDLDEKGFLKDQEEEGDGDATS